MQWRNSSSRYGLVTVVTHWVVALGVFALFALGFWMVGLNYYSSWYRTAPDLHKSFGILLFLLMLLRAGWRLFTPMPAPLASHGRLTRLASKAGHGFLYLCLFGVMIAGYLISTADGRPIEVFGLFQVPALISGLPGQEDVAGLIHEYLAWALVIFAGLHGLAALKHHFFDRDATLVRMFGRKPD